MIQRLACMVGLHQWETNRSIVKEPAASEEEIFLLKVTIALQRFCPICKLEGGKSVTERVEVFENEIYEEEEGWGA